MTKERFDRAKRHAEQVFNNGWASDVIVELVRATIAYDEAKRAEELPPRRLSSECPCPHHPMGCYGHPKTCACAKQASRGG